MEDNENDAYFLLRQLQRAGYAVTCQRVQTAPAMRAALQGQAWDIVIADYVMPRFSGLAALAELQAAGHDLPFIIVSGTIGEDTAVSAMKADAHDYLMKGKLARLAPAIERELREAEARRQQRQARTELLASEAKYKSLSDELPVGIYRSTADGRVLQANPALAALFGFAGVDDMVASGSVEALYADPEERHRQVVEWKPSGEPVTREIRSRTRDGREIWIRDTGRVIYDPVSQLAYMDGTVEDITEGKRAEAVQKAVNQIYEAAISTRNLEELYRSIHQILGALMPARNFFIALPDPATDTIRFPCFVDEYDAHPGGSNLAAGRGLTAYVLRTGRPLGAPPGKVSELVAEGEAEDLGAPSVDWIGVPLRIDEKTIGAMVVQSHTEGIRYSQADVNILALVSNQVAMAIDRKRAEESLRLAHVRRGTLLHDIGKMGIPDSVLLKPGTLAPEEWEIMRRHPADAHELLSPMAYLCPALDIPYCHHEKWGGTGHPRGLKGDQIPLAARIFAVVDVWDALCSDRSYRPAWPRAKVRAHIRSLAGSHFDRQVVTQFLNLDL